MKGHHVLFLVVVLLIGYYAGITWPSLPATIKGMF